VKAWNAERVALAAGARLEAGRSELDSEPGPRRTSIDSRQTRAGDLFVGLLGERSDGGEHAVQALESGAWGVLVEPAHARAAVAAGAHGAVLAHPEPLAGLQALAQAWQRELRAGGTRIVAITGSTGKTSTKDILAAILAGALRTVSSPENFNTEIGLPLAVLAAASDTEVLVLEMAMRQAGQIAQLTSIAEPHVAVIVNVGPVHLETLGTLEAIAAAKAELIAGLEPGATVVVPVDEPLLERHLRSDVHTLRFGDGGDFSFAEEAGEELVVRSAGDAAQGGRIVLKPSFAEAHNLRNLLAAVAVARTLGVTPEGRIDVSFSRLRGERIALGRGVVLINDCYNANPMSMRAAIDELAQAAPDRRVAVLGDMLELGPKARGFHREVGEHATLRGVELLVTVGPLAASMREGFEGEVHSVPDAAAAAELLGGLLHERDTVLVKGSRGVGLERVAEALGGEALALSCGAGPGRR
jgi:UDP-N-acetylmuramoyl-tripeptide--D-alanyl-D-alanine ligase